jgi:myosin-crossreactive antigen
MNDKSFELKIGGIITVKDTKYIIVNIVNYEEKNYLFCATAQPENVKPILFEYKKTDNDYYTKQITDLQLYRKISEKIYHDEVKKDLRK